MSLATDNVGDSVAKIAALASLDILQKEESVRQRAGIRLCVAC
jgi:hypothetical protein